jgi:hypothetical protein
MGLKPFSGVSTDFRIFSPEKPELPVFSKKIENKYNFHEKHHI